MTNPFFILTTILMLGCDSSSNDTTIDDSEVLVPVITIKEAYIDLDTSRTQILEQLATKKILNEPIIIHVMVPLCDNDHQGIVPVNSRLGNGQNLNTNLYWGAGYGIRTFFNKSIKWEAVANECTLSNAILERKIYQYADENRLIYLVADAYSGNEMKHCLKDYFQSMAGSLQDTILLSDGTHLPINGGASLLVFNGHNGLMDEDIVEVYNQDSVTKDAIVIACISGEYFNPFIKKAGGYPLVMTTNLLAPEAYVVHGVIEAWIADKSEEVIRKQAGAAYHKYQKCGIKGATRLFSTGW